ncbi:MAG: hypothetical protein LBQ40_05295 [Clostridiales bacterium]|nr:hypothetical protein [Clostridiales bacterium]
MPYKETKPVIHPHKEVRPVPEPYSPHLFSDYDPNFVPPEPVMPPDPYADKKALRQAVKERLKADKAAKKNAKKKR